MSGGGDVSGAVEGNRRPPILVLGMHRSGTSCLAGLLTAAGARPPGPVVRNWDNARGHFESTAVVRLNEAVLAHSGGHWLKPPPAVAWDAGHAAARDRLLAEPGALLKDPRLLLTLPLWLAACPAPALVGIVRHPLAVARSLLAWRQVPLEEGLVLWTAHNRALLALRRERLFPLVDFDRPAPAFIATVAALLPALGLAADTAVLHGAYAAELVHHDGVAEGATAVLASPAGTAAVALHRELIVLCSRPAAPVPDDHGESAGPPHARFPWAALREVQASCANNPARALVVASAALAGAVDPVAVAVPLVNELLRHRLVREALALIDGAPAGAPQVDCDPRADGVRPATLPPGLTGLLAGKALLATGRAAEAVVRLRAACAAADPPWEARHLLSQALRRAGERAAARAALAPLVADALYPHRILGTLAEWTWEDGERAAASDLMARAITEAPPHRRGRLRTRRATWLRALGEPQAAAEELARIAEEDPGWATAHGGGDG